MDQLEAKKTTRILRETFYNMTLYLEGIFFLHGVNDILADDIILCLEEEYAKAARKLRTFDAKKPGIRRTRAAEQFIRKLEQDRI